MTQEEKELLMKDLCARLPYHTIVKYRKADVDLTQYVRSVKLTECKPYLRPMSSITEEEKVEWQQIFELELKSLEADEGFTIASAAPSVFELDFYNKHHLDYRGLIEKGLALEAPEGMYN